MWVGVDFGLKKQNKKTDWFGMVPTHTQASTCPQKVNQEIDNLSEQTKRTRAHQFSHHPPCSVARAAPQTGLPHHVGLTAIACRNTQLDAHKQVEGSLWLSSHWLAQMDRQQIQYRQYIIQYLMYVILCMLKSIELSNANKTDC